MYVALTMILSHDTGWTSRRYLEISTLALASADSSRERAIMNCEHALTINNHGSILTKHNNSVELQPAGQRVPSPMIAQKAMAWSS